MLNYKKKFKRISLVTLALSALVGFSAEADAYVLYVGGPGFVRVGVGSYPYRYNYHPYPYYNYRYARYHHCVWVPGHYNRHGVFIGGHNRCF